MTSKEKLQLVAAVRKVAATLAPGEHRLVRRGYVAYKDESGQEWLLGPDIRNADAIIADMPARKLN